MRREFFSELVERAAEDERLVLCTADIGFGYIDAFKRAFPERLINFGVQEQNLIGAAAGLAADGLLPVCYSITPFVSLRPLEFFRNGAVFHNLPVTLVGAGTGFDYGVNGATHHAIDDFAIMRCLGNVDIFHPICAESLVEYFDRPDPKRPAYVRLTTTPPRVIPRHQDENSCSQCTVLALGSAYDLACEAMNILVDSYNLEINIMSVCSVRASDPSDALLDRLRHSRWVISLEEHLLPGGFGSYLLEVVNDHVIDCRVFRLGLSGRSLDVGSSQWLRSNAGLDPQSLAEKIDRIIKSNPSSKR